MRSNMLFQYARLLRLVYGAKHDTGLLSLIHPDLPSRIYFPSFVTLLGREDAAFYHGRATTMS